ncbi:hypothetical protein [Streptomyces sp. NPDC001070]
MTEHRDDMSGGVAEHRPGFSGPGFSTSADVDGAGSGEGGLVPPPPEIPEYEVPEPESAVTEGPGFQSPAYSGPDFTGPGPMGGTDPEEE